MKTLKFIVSRTDNIGDVILTFPLLGILKKEFPGCEIIFIGKSYTKEVSALNSNIDHFLNYSELEGLGVEGVACELKKFNADVIIHVYPNKLIAKAAARAKIPKRVGTSHRFFHLLTCNKLVNFTRKNSDLHEALLNLKLMPDLHAPAKEELYKYYGLENTYYEAAPKKKIIFHTKSFGSAVDWKMDHYIELARLLGAQNFHMYFTGTEKESPLISPYIQDLVKEGIATDMTGKFNLQEFIKFIGSCDALVACSTGPLHIASSLGIRALGLYSSHRPIHPGRWAPIGKHAYFIEAKDQNLAKPSINEITPNEVFSKIIGIVS